MEEKAKTEVGEDGVSRASGVIDDDMKKLQCDFQLSMMFGLVDIGCGELRMQDGKSVSTGRTARVGGVEKVVEGSLVSWELVCDVSAA